MAQMKPHLAITVSDVGRSLPFYRALLDSEPSKTKAGYVKFEPDEPSIVLTLIAFESFVPVPLNEKMLPCRPLSSHHLPLALLHSRVEKSVT